MSLLVKVFFGVSLLVKVSWKMFVLEAWILTFGESLVENALSSRVSRKSVKKECLTKSVKKECQARVSFQECPARVSSKSVKKECPARVSTKRVKKGCQERVSCKSAHQECQERVFSKECQEKQFEVFSLYFPLHIVTAFGFVGSIRFALRFPVTWFSSGFASDTDTFGQLLFLSRFVIFPWLLSLSCEDPFDLRGLHTNKFQYHILICHIFSFNVTAAFRLRLRG